MLRRACCLLRLGCSPTGVCSIPSSTRSAAASRCARSFLVYEKDEDQTPLDMSALEDEGEDSDDSLEDAIVMDLERLRQRLPGGLEVLGKPFGCVASQS